MRKDDSKEAATESFDDTKPFADLPELRPARAHQSVILVADDEPLIRNLVTLLMQREGHLVLAAANGHEGLELSRGYAGTIELIITDVEMPLLNGADLCAHLVEERPGIKVLMMSGADVSEVVSQNINLPFLPKPFDGRTLVSRVRAILAAPVQQPISVASDPTADDGVDKEVARIVLEAAGYGDHPKRARPSHLVLVG